MHHLPMRGVSKDHRFLERMNVVKKLIANPEDVTVILRVQISKRVQPRMNANEIVNDDDTFKFTEKLPG